MMKGNSDRKLACPSCGFKKWFSVNELTSEEKLEIDKFIEIRRGSKTRVVLPKFRKAIPQHKNAEKRTLSTRPQQKQLLVKKSSSPQEVTLHGKIKNIFKNKIKLYLPNYTERPAQIELSKKIGSSFVNNYILLAEAGVGTGKSFAYLVPIIQHYSDGPILISTKTINLQLIGKDIPLIKKIEPNLSTLLVKGQSHFLCNVRYSNVKFHDISANLLDKLEKWVESTNTGDRSDAPPIPDQLWNLINVEDCEGKECHLFSTDYCCFIKYKEKRKHFTGLIICNHNILTQLSHLKKGFKALI